MSRSRIGDPAREVRDFYGRRYRVGESDVELTGHSRARMMRLAWLSMLAISLFQYGFGAAIPALIRTRGWSLWDAFTVLAVWVVFQAGISVPATWIYRRGGARVAGPMLAGATLCLVAVLTLAHVHAVLGVLLGYSAFGGIGAGLVYMTCVGIVTEWFPERTATAVGRVGGAFAYGALPFVVIAAYALGFDNSSIVLDAIAVAVFIVVAVSGVLMRRPPANWWPAHIDPQRWAVDRRLNRSIPNNIPARRAYPPRAAIQSGMLPMMFVVVVLTAAMALFDISYLAGSLWFTGGQPLVIVAAVGVLALSTGVGRTVTGPLSDRLGRRRTLGLAVAMGGVAQFGLLAAVNSHQLLAIVPFAALAGVGTGAGYSLLVGMVRDWFGDDAALSNYGIVYTGKAVGGIAGIGLAGLVATTSNSTVAFTVAGFLGLLGAALISRMRQPGRPAIPVPGRWR